MSVMVLLMSHMVEQLWAASAPSTNPTIFCTAVMSVTVLLMLLMVEQPINQTTLCTAVMSMTVLLKSLMVEQRINQATWCTAVVSVTVLLLSLVGQPINPTVFCTAVMSVTVLLMSLMVEQLWVTLPGSPYFASPAHVGLTALILCVGAVLAFMMVWVEFTVIAQTSALTFMVAGTFKEVVTGGACCSEETAFACQPPGCPCRVHYYRFEPRRLYPYRFYCCIIYL